MVAATETKIINGRAAGTPSPMLPRIVTADVPLVGHFDLLATLALHVSEQQYLQLYTQSIVRSLYPEYCQITFVTGLAEFFALHFYCALRRGLILYIGAGMHRPMLYWRRGPTGRCCIF